MSTEYTIAKEVDSRGLNCPLPILKAKRALADMQSGEVLKVIATDPARCATSKPLPSKPAIPCWISKLWTRNLFT